MRGIKEVFARNLKMNRLKLGLTQEKLAEKADISTHCLAMVELAKKCPSAGMLERLAGALEVGTCRTVLLPSVAENALERLEAVIADNIERVVAEAIEKVLPGACKW